MLTVVDERNERKPLRNRDQVSIEVLLRIQTLDHEATLKAEWKNEKEFTELGKHFIAEEEEKKNV